MKVECRAYFEFRRKDPAAVTDTNNWIGLVPELAGWLDKLPESAIVDVAYPINMGTNSLVARWDEER